MQSTKTLIIDIDPKDCATMIDIDIDLRHAQSTGNLPDYKEAIKNHLAYLERLSIKYLTAEDRRLLSLDSPLRVNFINNTMHVVLYEGCECREGTQWKQ